MELKNIRVEVADHVATVVMDRPPVNAQLAFIEKRQPVFKGR